ncbi:Ig-like domain-containing protein [Nocardioides sp.]|uniref:Ig-like domain-containing protein n=1 Tax=Nocardioides sp. TaxID=35761 RepID=UPI002625419A|nr:Ig-like domain-containing protein [Nocardioides sp.]MCW2736524.1 hypothetical protein [Nocardioides sp.]
MNRPAHCRVLNRFTTSTVALAVVVPGSLLGLTQAPAAAAPLPAAYAASANADIVDLDAQVLGQGSLANAVIGHSASTVTSTAGGGTSGADSSNLDATLVFGGVPIPVDRETVTAPPTADPPSRALAHLPIDVLADVGAVTGDVQAAWAGSNACVPPTGGERILSDARTTLAGVSLLDVPPVGTLAEVTASEIRTRTALVDVGAGSDVVSRATTTVGDIDLLGGQVTVDVTHPVVLQARSNGTTGSAGFVSPPAITATVAGTPVDIPLNATPQSIALPDELAPLVDLTITAFNPTDQSSGATGKGTLDALLRIDLKVLSLVPLTPPVAQVSLAVAPMSVEASAPAGGVECGAGDTTAPAVPVVTTPAAGSVTNDATPTFEGTAEPGSTVVVRDPSGAEVCTGVADTDGAWTCTPGSPLPDGEATYTATATDGGGNTSPATSTTFTVDTTAPAVTIFTPADGAATTDLSPEVTGVSEAGASITVREGGLTVCTTTASGSGAWSCTPTTPLTVGQHTFTATAQDAAGNAADTATTFSVVIIAGGDAVAPAAPDIATPTSGSSTDDTTPRIAGTGETGATVTVREGSTVLCTAVVGGGGSWSCTPAVALPLGAHTVTATQTDASGNTSPSDTTTFSVVAGPGNGDGDGDGLPDRQEGTIGTNPANPDTDGDGLTDGDEVHVHGTQPTVKDTDKDGLTDGQEVGGVKIRERFEVCGKKARTSITVTTNPLRKDTDKDGLSDGEEVKGYTIKQHVLTRAGTFVIGRTRSNPTKKDTDRDGLEDKVEKTGKANKRFGRAKTDPSKCDTDQGGISDGAEVRARSNPSDVKSGPRRPQGRANASDRLPHGMG